MGLAVVLGVSTVGAVPAGVERAGGGGWLVDGEEVAVVDVVVPAGRDPALPEGASVAEQRGVDRWGRRRVALADAAGVPLAGRWVAEGEALVDPDAGDEAAAVLLPLEVLARDARLGIWAERRWRVQDARDVRGSTGDLVLVEGAVQAVGWGGDRLYLNFGDDRRQDFTARIGRADVRKLARAGLELEDLAGRRVRLRGWLSYLGGPMIELSGRAQIEVLP
ncbi:MAG TPA: hypothetical protein PKA13_17875 [Geminicoccaceae bacterium]|nr:hypothetical protein [Geminicoccus sp.]HMU51648.1 hypothetical protein [Geminicoccaceae bacterium]